MKSTKLKTQEETKTQKPLIVPRLQLPITPVSSLVPSYTIKEVVSQIVNQAYLQIKKIHSQRSANSELPITPKVMASKSSRHRKFKTVKSPNCIMSPHETATSDEEFWKHLVSNIHESIFIISSHYKIVCTSLMLFVLIRFQDEKRAFDKMFYEWNNLQQEKQQASKTSKSFNS